VPRLPTESPGVIRDRQESPISAPRRTSKSRLTDSPPRKEGASRIRSRSRPSSTNSCKHAAARSPEFSLSLGGARTRLAHFRISVYTFRTPCVCLQRRVLAHFSAINSETTARRAQGGRIAASNRVCWPLRIMRPAQPSDVAERRMEKPIRNQYLGMVHDCVEPYVIPEARGLDNQRVSIPMSDRVTVPPGLYILGR
jgi:hypothetical protein